ncbi:uncharacterized protein LOC116339978 [Contarinia nasturtii]|uniref:uncharacterized protein LOC116339978 n=1 Tax=Contarinia nasturtii TaxID=265458 RepID=UPI0012D384DF|nr:uncharacterized protein LOC116339978 [Contarinia nasturtii]
MSHQQKKLNLSHPDNQDHNEIAVADPSNVESPPKIFNLTVDCFDEIFEYLNMEDLHSFGQTCKRMNKVAGEYFKQNHSSAENFCKYNAIHTTYSDKDGVVEMAIETSGFNKFVPCIKICGNDFDILRYIQSQATEFESTNQMFHVGFDINDKLVEHFEQLLPQLEILRYTCCRVDGDLYDLMLKYCKNLREIYVQNSTVGNRINGEIKWLLQEYPKLECLELSPSDSSRIEELRTFFVRNPNVQRFSTSVDFLWNNGDIFLNSNTKLDILELKDKESMQSSSYRKQTLDLLNRLHEQGFYKRLYIYIYEFNEELSNSLASVKGLEL